MQNKSDPLESAILSDYCRRAEIRKAQYYAILNALFSEQRAFVLDSSSSKAALCTRRAGKSFTAASMLLMDTLSRDEVDVLYIALTRRSAKLILWEEIKRFDTRYKIGCRFDSTELIGYVPNGSRIILGGADDLTQIEKYRGLALVKAIIDEAQAFKDSIIQPLVEEVLQPTLLDWNGSLCMTGTPHPACAGYFHDATNLPNEEWVTHRWSVVQNPHVPKSKEKFNNAEEWIQDVKRRKGWADDNPIYLREWRGLWVRSTESIVYRFNRERDVIETLPEGVIQYVLGIDLGYDDATAFVIMGFIEERRQLFIVECFKRSGMIVDEIAQRVKRLDDHYKFVRKVADTGGLGKMIVEELNKRHLLDIKPAEKKEKYDFIELMNSDFEYERIKVLECESTKELIEEWQLLQWDEDRRKEDERFDNHLADAALYGWRECLHWIGEIPEELPDYGTDDYWQREADLMEQREMDEFERANNPDLFFDEW